MTNLTDTQIALLTAAVHAEGGSIDMPSEGKRSIAGLIKRGLLISIPQEDGPRRLLITELGKSAIADIGGQALDSGPVAPPPVHEDTANPLAKGHGKIARLVELLADPHGCTIQAMMAATGWQSHSVRGALSGAIKKGLGLPVVSEKSDGVRRYRISAVASA